MYTVQVCELQTLFDEAKMEEAKSLQVSVLTSFLFFCNFTSAIIFSTVWLHPTQQLLVFMDLQVKIVEVINVSSCNCTKSLTSFKNC